MEKELLPCDVAVSLQIFGTKIKILVVKELLKGTKRFSELNRAIPCTQKVLTSNLRELEKDKIYKSVLVDTFSLLVNEWKNENVTKKKKKMTQQAWGDLLTETEDIINRYHKISTKKWVILTGHEVMDSIEGMEDELLPDVRIAVSKGARTYLEGMANYGIHTLKLQREVEDKEGNIKTVVKYAANIGPDPYYWTKLQIDSSIKVPSIIINPTFSKLMKIVGLAE